MSNSTQMHILYQRLSFNGDPFKIKLISTCVFMSSSTRVFFSLLHNDFFFFLKDESVKVFSVSPVEAIIRETSDKINVFFLRMHNILADRLLARYRKTYGP